MFNIIVIFCILQIVTFNFVHGIYPTTKISTISPKKCHSPNQTISYQCPGCFDTCSGKICVKCMPEPTPRCICSKGYCPCPGPNEVFKTCSSICTPNCTVPNPICGPPKCQCRQGYVRNAKGICIDKESCPAAVCTKLCMVGHHCVIGCDGKQQCIPNNPCGPSSTQPTTTNSAGGIRCLSGIGYFTDCEWPKRTPEGLAKCKEENRQIAKKAYTVEQCSSGQTECYSFSHKCHSVDEGKFHLEKGCASPGNVSCVQRIDQMYCRFGDANRKCEQCKGDLCNKKDVTY